MEGPPLAFQVCLNRREGGNTKRTTRSANRRYTFQPPGYLGNDMYGHALLVAVPAP